MPSPLSPAQLSERSRALPQWTINAAGHLERAFDFPDFAAALAFVNRVGSAAEEANHHPDIALSYGKAVVELWSHDVKGLTDRDFALASAIDTLISG